MPSPSLDSTHGQTTLGVTCHHRLWTAHTVEKHRVWLNITALGLHARSDDVWHGMTSLPLDSTHGRQRRAWHDITAIGQHTQSDDIERDMTSPPLDSTHGQTTSGVACHHLPWTTCTVGRRRAWYDIMAVKQHTRSNDIRCGMPS